jgi:transcriptional regulator with XRE-family HTH domain
MSLEKLKKQCDKELGYRLKQAREHRNMPESTLADKLGVSKQHIIQYEKGSLPLPAHMIAIVGAKLGVSASQFIGDASAIALNNTAKLQAKLKEGV